MSIATIAPNEAASRLEAFFYAEIPLTQAMDLRVVHLDHHSIRLLGPLEPNRNDKGTAFGGSLATMLTLAGWGMVRHLLDAQSVHADIVIHRSEMLYNKPVDGEIACYCDAPSPEMWGKFLDQLNRRGKSRLKLTSWVSATEGAAATMTGHYVAMLKT